MWEYKVIELPLARIKAWGGPAAVEEKHERRELSENILNEHGNAGWEMIHGVGYTVFLKRPKDLEEPPFIKLCDGWEYTDLPKKGE